MPLAGAEIACAEHDPDAIRDVWAALAARRARPTIFLTPEWLGLARAHHGRPVTLAVGDPPYGIVPLARDDDGTLRFAGGPESDLQDVLAPAGTEREVAGAFAEWLVRAAPPRVSLELVPEDAPTLELVAERLSRAGWSVTRSRQDTSPYIGLPETFEAYVASLPRVERHELRRKLRRLDNAGHVEARPARADEAGAVLERFFALHRLAPGRKGAFMTAAMESYFRRVAAALAPLGRLHLGTVRVDGEIAAVTFGFVYGGTLASYNSAYDPRFRDLAVGLAAHAYDIRSAILAGLGTYDVLRGDERYKYDLGGKDRVLERLEATP
ncbi:MAG TPA: GNAT family N-acetyltransferase [Candidatus Limnocylindria bacterium]|nr:GNAT family N-acetyltransferase [Candidatus Limnocylindria bacterium]